MVFLFSVFTYRVDIAIFSRCNLCTGQHASIYIYLYIHNNIVINRRKILCRYLLYPFYINRRCTSVHERLTGNFHSRLDKCSTARLHYNNEGPVTFNTQTRFKKKNFLTTSQRYFYYFNFFFFLMEKIRIVVVVVVV